MTGDFNVIGGIKYNADSIKSFSRNEQGLYNVELKNGSCFTYYEQTHVSDLDKQFDDVPSILADKDEKGCKFYDCRLESVKDNPEQIDFYMFDNKTKIKNLSVAEWGSEKHDFLINLNPKNVENFDFHG